MEQLNEKIIGWLNTQGYPLEMKVANQFKNAGFGVLQSRYFNDFEEQKPREIDITAAILAADDKSTTSVIYTIECKKSLEKPWVIFTANETKDKNHSLSGCFAISEMVKNNRNIDMNMFNHYVSILHPCRIFGHGITQCFTSGYDVAYSAIMGSLKASIGRISSDIEYQEYVFAIPIVIFEGKLFECNIGRDEKIVVHEVKEGSIQLNINMHGFNNPKVKIVTYDGLSDFIVNAKKFAECIATIIDGNEII
jgi:hypothetical protein